MVNAEKTRKIFCGGINRSSLLLSEKSWYVHSTVLMEADTVGRTETKRRMKQGHTDNKDRELIVYSYPK